MPIIVDNLGAVSHTNFTIPSAVITRPDLITFLPFTKPIVEYRFTGTAIANQDGSFPAEVRNLQYEASSFTTPGWGELSGALNFTAGSSLLIPAEPPIRSLKCFGVEMVIAPAVSREPLMKLIEGQVTPFAFALVRDDAGYRLSGSVHVRHRMPEQYHTDWMGVTTTTTIRPQTWTKVAMVFDGDSLTLLINDQVEARRVFRAAELAALQLTPAPHYFVGTWVDRARNPYSGKIAGIRLWNSTPTQFLRAIATAEQAGMGEIDSLYEDLGGSGGFLGAPLGPEVAIAGGRKREFSGGAIFWSQRTGAHEVHGEIWRMYRQPSIQAQLGFPWSDERNTRRAGSRVSYFENGAIYWSGATGTGVLWGAAYARYRALGGETSFLGLPKGTPFGPSSNPNMQNLFEYGRIYTNERDFSYEVHGAILERYLQLNGASGFLGLPVSDELPIYNRSGQEIGRMSRFEGGTLYWSPATGAFEVHGDILKTYQKIGGPVSELGFPVTDELGVEGTGIRYNGFQKGVIVWKSYLGARVITALELYLDKVAQNGSIDDGVWDSSAELISYVTIRANGVALENGTRMPSGHAGSTYQWNRSYTIPIRHNTQIEISLRYDDWDQVSANDYLGTYSRTFDISSFWGSGDTGVGLYDQQPMTHKGGDSPSHASLLTSFRISHPAQPVDWNRFRREAWWSYPNQGNAPLSRALYTQTFRDVDVVDGTWEAILNPFDSLYYELAFKNVAKGGNCFGMSTEALHSLMGTSFFPEHIYPYSREQTLSRVNIKQAYQVGAESIRWTIKQLLSIQGFAPVFVFQSARAEIDRRGACLISMFNLRNMTGHTVLAYRYEAFSSGDELGRLYVADPNKPWRDDNSGTQGHPSFIRILRNNTFRAETITTSSNSTGFASNPIVNGLLPTTVMFHTPYSIVAPMPRTPFWEILGLLTAAIGGLLILAGDAESEQVSVNNRQLFRTVEGQKLMTVGEIPGLAVIPQLDAGEAPRVFASDRPLNGVLKLDLRGLRNGHYHQMAMFSSSATEVMGPIAQGAADILTMTDTQTAFPQVGLQTSEALKLANVKLSVLLDPKGRDSRIFSLPLQQARNELATVQVDPRGGALLVSPAGPARPIDISLDLVEGTVLKKSIIRQLMPSVGNEVMRIAPVDWSTPVGDVIVERLSSIGGSVIERLILQSVAR